MNLGSAPRTVRVPDQLYSKIRFVTAPFPMIEPLERRPYQIAREKIMRFDHERIPEVSIP